MLSQFAIDFQYVEAVFLQTFAACGPFLKALPDLS